jgi:hypothetical protein
MTYEDRRVRCDNYRWLSRTLNKGHHQIENDSYVWDKIVTLIDSELSNPNSGDTATSDARAVEMLRLRQADGEGFSGESFDHWSSVSRLRDGNLQAALTETLAVFTRASAAAAKGSVVFIAQP